MTNNSCCCPLRLFWRRSFWRQQSISVRRRRRLTGSVMLVCLGYTCCWLPYWAVQLFVAFQGEAPTWLWAPAYSAQLSSSAVNPLIFLLGTKTHRTMCRVVNDGEGRRREQDRSLRRSRRRIGSSNKSTGAGGATTGDDDYPMMTLNTVNKSQAGCCSTSTSWSDDQLHQ